MCIGIGYIIVLNWIQSPGPVYNVQIRLGGWVLDFKSIYIKLRKVQDSLGIEKVEQSNLVKRRREIPAKLRLVRPRVV